jgi:hypothetical protein
VLLATDPRLPVPKLRSDLVKLFEHVKFLERVIPNVKNRGQREELTFQRSVDCTRQELGQLRIGA